MENFDPFHIGNSTAHTESSHQEPAMLADEGKGIVLVPHGRVLDSEADAIVDFDEDDDRSLDGTVSDECCDHAGYSSQRADGFVSTPKSEVRPISKQQNHVPSTKISSLEAHVDLRRRYPALQLTPDEQAEARCKWHHGNESAQVQEKIQRWETYFHGKRQAIQNLADALEPFMEKDLWNTASYRPSKNPSICGGGPSSCSIYLARCLEYCQQWTFLLPLLEDSALRLTKGAKLGRPSKSSSSKVTEHERLKAVLWSNQPSYLL